MRQDILGFLKRYSDFSSTDHIGRTMMQEVYKRQGLDGDGPDLLGHGRHTVNHAGILILADGVSPRLEIGRAHV